ncbi:type II toxin-antitoxin system Phd/YefM family antitoxin [Levilactobacillus yiduensis]|uniref:type II toxin-antitoxin system Phd/YefM family antitoxin n=1 Tax=Levilactobacillus yiduensis TaxID=2953880 RepID=UPI000EF30878|nr:type II toxin-antitoxin system Phd/YefM family antitoxin [Levilactobacillus yiduensis]AYM01880.1 type II toxin-antitoxin system Phd/YefM family antitoxin [Levilactobacillus brevis]
MDATSYPYFRKRIKHYMKTVTNNQEPLMITRKNKRNVVLISVEEYSTLLENQFILSHLESRAWLQTAAEPEVVAESMAESAATEVEEP